MQGLHGQSEHHALLLTRGHSHRICGGTRKMARRRMLPPPTYFSTIATMTADDERACALLLQLRHRHYPDPCCHRDAAVNGAAVESPMTPPRVVHTTTQKKRGGRTKFPEPVRRTMRQWVETHTRNPDKEMLYSWQQAFASQYDTYMTFTQIRTFLSNARRPDRRH